MVYVPNPQDTTQPTDIGISAATAPGDLRGIKSYMATTVGNGRFRNKFCNGNFNVADRGAGPFTVLAGGPINIYTLNQWMANTAGGNTVVSQNTGAVNAATNYIQCQPAIGNTNFILTNRIEALDCSDLVAGSTVTISGWYNVTSGAPSFPTITLYTPTTTANTFWSFSTISSSILVTITPQIQSVWQYFSQSFILSGNAFKGLQVDFAWPAGAPSQIIKFSQLQCELGAYATPFEYTPIAEDQNRCSRYYQLLGWNMIATAAGAGSILGGTNNFRIQMRAAPSISRNTVSSSNSSFVGAPFTTTTYFFDDILSNSAGTFFAAYIATLTAEL